MAKPVVDGIQKALMGEAQVLRLNVMDDIGGQLALRYGVRAVPTFVLLDGSGEVIGIHTGIPSREKIVTAITEQGR